MVIRNLTKQQNGNVVLVRHMRTTFRSHHLFKLRSVVAEGLLKLE